jgi:hypothetical protein
MNIEKQTIADLFEVIRNQHTVLTYLVANDQALVEALANALPYFSDSFQNKHSYALEHPKGPLAEALSAMQGMLDAIGATLKRDTGGLDN